MIEDKLKSAYLEATINELSPDEFIQLLKYKKLDKDVFGYQLHEIVCNAFKIPVENLYIRRRTRDTIVIPRQTCMYFRVKYTKDTYTDIGKIYGTFDHATVMASINRISNYIETWPEFAKLIDQIEKELKG
jgi:chromosomal replication initiation ATPase DnaA